MTRRLENAPSVLFRVLAQEDDAAHAEELLTQVAQQVHQEHTHPKDEFIKHGHRHRHQAHHGAKHPQQSKSISPFAVSQNHCCGDNSDNLTDLKLDGTQHIDVHTNGHCGHPQAPAHDRIHVPHINGAANALATSPNGLPPVETHVAHLTVPGDQQIQPVKDDQENGAVESYLRAHGSARSTLSTSTLDDDLAAHHAALAEELLVFTPEVILQELLGSLFIHPGRLWFSGVLGQGGFATVHKATLQPEVAELNPSPSTSSRGEVVAVKKLKAKVLDSPADLKDFLLEVNVMRKLRHENIISIKGIGASDLTSITGMRGSMYVVMEALEGGTLRSVVIKQMNSGTPVYSCADALRWAIQIASAIQYLHTICKPMIIHRDLKLENVLMSDGPMSSRVAKLADFGLHKRARVDAGSGALTAVALRPVTTYTDEHGHVHPLLGGSPRSVTGGLVRDMSFYGRDSNAEPPPYLSMQRNTSQKSFISSSTQQWYPSAAGDSPKAREPSSHGSDSGAPPMLGGGAGSSGGQISRGRSPGARGGSPRGSSPPPAPSHQFSSQILRGSSLPQSSLSGPLVGLGLDSVAEHGEGISSTYQVVNRGFVVHSTDSQPLADGVGAADHDDFHVGEHQQHHHDDQEGSVNSSNPAVDNTSTANAATSSSVNSSAGWAAGQGAAPPTVAPSASFSKRLSTGYDSFVAMAMTTLDPETHAGAKRLISALQDFQDHAKANEQTRALTVRTSVDATQQPTQRVPLLLNHLSGSGVSPKHSLDMNTFRGPSNSLTRAGNDDYCTQPSRALNRAASMPADVATILSHPSQAHNLVGIVTLMATDDHPLNAEAVAVEAVEPIIDTDVRSAVGLQAANGGGLVAGRVDGGVSDPGQSDSLKVRKSKQPEEPEQVPSSSSSRFLKRFASSRQVPGKPTTQGRAVCLKAGASVEPTLTKSTSIVADKQLHKQASIRRKVVAYLALDQDSGSRMHNSSSSNIISGMLRNSSGHVLATSSLHSNSSGHLKAGLNSNSMNRPLGGSRDNLVAAGKDGSHQLPAAVSEPDGGHEPALQEVNSGTALLLRNSSREKAAVSAALPSKGVAGAGLPPKPNSFRQGLSSVFKTMMGHPMKAIPEYGRASMGTDSLFGSGPSLQQDESYNVSSSSSQLLAGNERAKSPFAVPINFAAPLGKQQGSGNSNDVQLQLQSDSASSLPLLNQTAGTGDAQGSKLLLTKGSNDSTMSPVNAGGETASSSVNMTTSATPKPGTASGRVSEERNGQRSRGPSLDIPGLKLDGKMSRPASKASLVAAGSMQREGRPSTSGGGGGGGGGILKAMTLSRAFSRADSKAVFSEATFQVGSLMYMAPELLKGEPYNQKIDVFSFAIILWELFSGKLVTYRADLMLGDDKDIMAYVKRRSEGERERIHPDWPTALRALVEQCWDQDPLKRPGFEEIVKRLQDLRSDPEMQKFVPSRFGGGGGGCCSVM